MCLLATSATWAEGAPDLVTESERLTAPVYGMDFGANLSIDGDTIMAQGADFGFPPYYDVQVFTRGADGRWQDAGLLENGNRDEDIVPGEAIDIDGDRASVAYGGFNIARVDVFARGASGDWNRVPGGISLGDCASGFELQTVAVSLSGETSVVAYTGGDAFGDCDDDAVFDVTEVFDATSAQDLGPAGPSVIDRGVVLLGMPAGDGRVAGAGAVQVFEADAAGVWQPVALLVAPDGQAGAAFGCSVALDDSVALVGACADDEAGAEAGAVYVFVRNGSGAWQYETKLLPGVATGRQGFGGDLALSEGMALIRQSGIPQAGLGIEASFHVFALSRDASGAWTTLGELVAGDGLMGEDGAVFAGFGATMDISGGTAVVAAPNGDEGALYVYDLAGLMDAPPLEDLATFVSFEPDPSSFRSSGEVSGCQAGAVGTFGFVAVLGNTGSEPLRDLQLAIATLTRGNLLLTPQGLLGPGDRVLVPRVGPGGASGAYADGDLAPGELVDVPFSVCLASRQSFRLNVDVLGRPAEDAEP